MYIHEGYQAKKSKLACGGPNRQENLKPVFTTKHGTLKNHRKLKDVLKILKTSSSSYLCPKQSSQTIISQTILVRLSL